MVKRLCMMISVCALALCAMLVCAGCSGDSDYQPELKSPTISSPTIAEDGVLRVGVDADSSPLAGMNNDNIIGIDVDIAAYIADELGLKLSIVDVGNDPAGALSENKVDIVMGVNEDSDAFESLWTTEQYLPKGVVLFSLASKDAAVPTSAEGITIAAQTSSTSAWAVTNSFGENALTSTSNLQEAFSLLASDSVDFVAADAVIGLYAARVQDVDVNLTALLTAASGYHVGVSSENTELQTAVGDALNTLVSEGIVNIVETKWLGRTLDLDIPKIDMTADTTETAEEPTTEGNVVISTEAPEPEPEPEPTTEEPTTATETESNEGAATTYSTDEDEGGGMAYREYDDEDEDEGGMAYREYDDEEDYDYDYDYDENEDEE